jgi:hypothetical protein
MSSTARGVVPGREYCELALTGLGGTAVDLVLVDWDLFGPECDCPRRGVADASRVEAAVADIVSGVAGKRDISAESRVLVTPVHERRDLSKLYVIDVTDLRYDAQ